MFSAAALFLVSAPLQAQTWQESTLQFNNLPKIDAIDLRRRRAIESVVHTDRCHALRELQAAIRLEARAARVQMLLEPHALRRPERTEEARLHELAARAADTRRRHNECPTNSSTIAAPAALLNATPRPR